MTWAFKRQLLYAIILILLVCFLIFLVFYSHFNKAPTCFDGQKNGTETGVDCGGSCLKACSAELSNLSVLWTRVFKVIPGRYNAVAYLENHNQNAAVQKIKYRFRFADANNIYIGKREGETYIPPGGYFAIFESAIGVGNSVPVYASFEFTQTPSWSQVSTEKLNQLKLLVSDINLEDQTTKPRLSASLKNNSLFFFPEVNVVAILYDAQGNAISASRTYLEELKAEEEVKLNFTWPEPIQKEVVQKEIIPLYNIFSAKLK